MVSAGTGRPPSRRTPGMYGTDPSMPGRYALDLFAREKASRVLELGAG